MYYPSSENKGADHEFGYREADLRLCFFAYADCWFSHEAAQIINSLGHIGRVSVPGQLPKAGYQYIVHISSITDK